jgi:uncharacterized membrane protein YeaQ/YmgE (transglycosylase-associated protein family)
MNKNIKIVCCVLGAGVGMVINAYFNKTTSAFEFAFAAVIGASITNWIIGLVE